MENYPKKGMTHEQARVLALRHARGGDPNIVAAVIRQAEMHEKGSGRALQDEVKRDYGKKRVDIHD